MDLDDFSQIFGNRKSIWIIGKLNEKNPVYQVGQVDIAVEQCDGILHGLANHRDKTSVFAAINFWWGKGVAAMPLTPAKYFHDTQSLVRFPRFQKQVVWGT